MDALLTNVAYDIAIGACQLHLFLDHCAISVCGIHLFYPYFRLVHCFLSTKKTAFMILQFIVILLLS